MSRAPSMRDEPDLRAPQKGERRAARMPPAQALAEFHRRIEQERYHAHKDVPEAVLSAELLEERLKREGWSQDAIDHRRDETDDGGPTLLGGLIDSYYDESLMPVPIDYLYGETAIHVRHRNRPSVRFPWWRSACGG